MKKLLLAAATSALLFSGAAMAQTGPTAPNGQSIYGTGTTGASATTPAKPQGRDAGIVQTQAPTTVPESQNKPTSTGQDSNQGSDLGK